MLSHQIPALVLGEQLWCHELGVWMLLKELRTNYEIHRTQTLGLQRSPVLPHLQSSWYQLSVEHSGKNHESTFAHLPWKRRGCQELRSLWEGESSRKFVPGGLCGRGNPTFPANLGLSALLPAFEIGSIVPDCNSGWTECACGQVGGGGCLGKCTDTTWCGWSWWPRLGRNPVQQYRENSQRGKVSAGSILCAREVLKLESAACERDFLWRLPGSIVGLIHYAESPEMFKYPQTTSCFAFTQNNRLLSKQCEACYTKSVV